MMKSRNGIPDEVLKEIFPKKLRRSRSSEQVYAQLKKGQKLTQEGIAQDFNISRAIVHKVISQLKEDELIISEGRKGSFVT